MIDLIEVYLHWTPAGPRPATHLKDLAQTPTLRSTTKFLSMYSFCMSNDLAERFSKAAYFLVVFRYREHRRAFPTRAPTRASPD